MVLCKFFLQGTCRFGSSCKFEHQVNTDHSYTGSSSILLQNQQNKPAVTNVDTNTLVKAVVNDMTAAEKGGQWLLSSYAPFKEKPLFPGFEDHSMEEVRYLFYESVKSGTVEQYKQNLQMMLQQTVMKIKALQNPSPDAVNLLKNIYNAAPSSSFNSNSKATLFGPGGGTTAPSSAFPAPTAQKSIFGANAGQSGFANTPPQQGAFVGTNNSIFSGGQNANKSIFGVQPQNTSQNKSIFAGSQPSPPPNNSLFGPPPQVNTQQSIFGNPPFGATPAPQQNMFQQGANQFMQPQRSPLVAPPNTSAQFVNHAAGAQFVASGFPPAQTSFINSQSGAPVVPVTGTSKPAFQHTQNIFGKVAQPTGNSMFGNQAQGPKPNEEFYSKMEDLTEEEIKWFQSDDLDISRIPEKPPTYEMCFRM